MAGAPELTVHIGSIPYPWANPNVWNVVGSPDGSPSDPVVGAQNWCWVKVKNEGTEDTTVTVRFYYCTPNGAVDKWRYFINNPAGSTAPTPIAAGETKELVATSSWAPPSTGHVCILCVASAPDDPAPPQDPDIAPQINDRHIAQRNMTAALARAGAAVEHEFQVAPGTTLVVSRGKASSLMPLFGQLGVAAAPAELGDAPFGIVPEGAARIASGLVQRMQVTEATAPIQTLRVEVPPDARPGQGAFFRIEALDAGGQVVGGTGLLVRVQP
ncbi:MAG TPA: hypothetical protein VF158_17155 [Longimicrobiales bacterium]